MKVARYRVPGTVKKGDPSRRDGMSWANRTEAIRGHFDSYRPFRLADLSRTRTNC